MLRGSARHPRHGRPTGRGYRGDDEREEQHDIDRACRVMVNRRARQLGETGVFARRRERWIGQPHQAAVLEDRGRSSHELDAELRLNSSRALLCAGVSSRKHRCRRHRGAPSQGPKRGFTGAHAALPHLVQTAEDSPCRVADMVSISSTGARRSTRCWSAPASRAGSAASRDLSARRPGRRRRAGSRR